MYNIFVHFLISTHLCYWWYFLWHYFPIFYLFPVQDKQRLWIATTFKRRFCIQFMPKEDGKRYFCRLINFVQFYWYLHAMFSYCICLKKTLLTALAMSFWFVLSFFVLASYWVSKSEIFTGFSLLLSLLFFRTGHVMFQNNDLVFF